MSIGQEASVLWKALRTRDVGIFMLSLILGFIPFGIMLIVFEFTQQHWGIQEIRWRYELVFAAFVSCFVTLIQFWEFAVTKRPMPLIVVYLGVTCSAFACAFILAFYNNRDSLAEFLANVHKPLDRLDLAYRFAAACSIGLAVWGITFSLALVIWHERHRLLTQRLVITSDISKLGE